MPASNPGFRIRIRTQLIVGFALLSGVGFYFLGRSVMGDLRPRYQEAMEEGMVDQAQIFSALIERNMRGDSLPVEELREAFRQVQHHRFSAQIHNVVKTSMDMRLYVTDASGIVRFDSDSGRDEGRDYSQWRDVYLTLQGKYGARATRTQSSDPTSSILYVAAPIRHDGKIAGVVTVVKPTRGMGQFIEAARLKIGLASAATAAGVAMVGWLLLIWVTRPIRRLTAYARAVRDGKPSPPPSLGRSEIRDLGLAFEEMKEALEGRKYVESYVHALTHALKSPLASMRGAAELLQEEMPVENRKRFTENILAECGRMDRLVAKMLGLASLETRNELETRQPVKVREWIHEVFEEFQPLAQQGGIHLETKGIPDASISGDAFLLRQGLGNLLENAMEFSPRGAKITLTAQSGNDRLDLILEDQGPGVPSYAMERVFEKFFSLPRPASGRKSTGLGLSWVREITRLHGGTIRLENRPDGGLRVLWSIPSGP